MSQSDQLSKMIKLCQTGQNEGFVWLVRQYGPQLYRFFLRATGSAADAEDLLQDLFIRLIEKISGYRHQGRFESWLFRVASNLLRDWARQRQRHAQAMALLGSREAVDRHATDRSRPERRLEQAEVVDRLQDALQKLPQPDREIVLLRHYGGLSFKELAEQFEMPIGTVLAKVHRGLKRLKGMLRENGKL